MTENNESTSPFGRTWKIAAGFVAVILAIVIIGVLWPSSEDAQEAAPSHQNATPDTTAPNAPNNSPETTPTSDSQCPELSTDTSMPTSAPETSWDRHPVGMIVPTNEEHGPAVQNDSFWGCYSQTPTGALFAGLGMLSNASAGEVEAVIDSPARDGFMELNAIEGSESLPTVEDFRIIMANDEEAVVEYTILNNNDLAFIRVSMAWSEEADDWRLKLEGDQTSIPGGGVSDPSAYISWR